MGDVSIPTSIQPRTMVVNDLLGSGYTSDEVREALNAGFMVEEENVIEVVQENVQFPKSSCQQANERQHDPIKM